MPIERSSDSWQCCNIRALFLCTYTCVSVLSVYTHRCLGEYSTFMVHQLYPMPASVFECNRSYPHNKKKLPVLACGCKGQISLAVCLANSS